MAKVTKVLPKARRTSDGLIDVMFDEIDGLRDGSRSPTVSNAVARQADQICKVKFLELAVQKHANSIRVRRSPALAISLGK